MPRINPTVTPEAKEIYEKHAKKHQGGEFVSSAIIEKERKETGVIFTAEQIEYLNKYYIRKDDK
jgi:hypothetical protein